MTDNVRDKLRGDIQRRAEVYSRNHTPAEVKAFNDYYDNFLTDFSNKSEADLRNLRQNSDALPDGLMNMMHEVNSNLPATVNNISQAYIDKTDPSTNYQGNEFYPTVFTKGRPLVARKDYNDSYGKNNAFYKDDDNTIRFGSEKMRNAYWHELGHAMSQAYGLTPKRNGREWISKMLKATGERSYSLGSAPYSYDRDWEAASTPVRYIDAYGGHYPGYNDQGEKWNNIKSYWYPLVNEEVRASAFGAQKAIEAGMDPRQAYNVAFSGVPSYTGAAADAAGILNYKQADQVGKGVSAMLDEREAYDALGKNQNTQNSHRFYSPVTMPTYTGAEQQAAIDQERNSNNYWGVASPLGKRPEGFEQTGLWVPGMTPLTPQDKMMDRAVRGLSPRRYENDGTFMDMYNGSKQTNMVQKLPSYNYKDYTTLQQFGNDVFDAFSSTDPNAIDSLQNKYWPKDFYVDKNRWREWGDIYNSFRGLGPDGMPTERALQRMQRLIKYDPSRPEENRKKYQEWAREHNVIGN